MSAYKLTTTVLATKLAEAVAKDERPEEGGFDLSAGMFGIHVSNWIRSVAAQISPPEDGEEVIVKPLVLPISSPIEKELAQTKEVLGTLIGWLILDLGAENVKTLLDKLHAPIE